MAAAHYTTFSLSKPPNRLSITSIRTTPLLLFSQIPTFSSSFQSRPTTRKNHLRQKFLKTLIKPCPLTSTHPLLPNQPPTSPITPILSPEKPCPDDLETKTELPSDQILVPIARENDAEEFHVSETLHTAGECSGNSGNFPLGYVKKFGVYIIGIFVFQTICAVWVLGNANSNRKDKNAESMGFDIDGDSPRKRKLFLNGNKGKILHGNFGSKTSKFVYLDESVLEEKIEEIRAMAREARKIEKKETSEDGNDDDVEDENAISRARIGIEKEIDARLVKLQKNFPESYVSHLNKSKKDDYRVKKDGLDVNDGNGTLMFKKKLKFRSPSIESEKRPKGFQGLEDNRKKKSLSGRGAIMEDENIGDDRLGESVLRNLEEGDERNLAIEEPILTDNDREKMDEGAKGRNHEPANGVVQETSSVEKLKSRKSKESRIQNLQSSKKGNREASATSDLPTLWSAERSPDGNKSRSRKVRDKQSKSETDLWWLNLPYVLGILMHRGSNDEEGAGGLFTLRIPSRAQDQEDPYTVAFEDHVDANNFCFLLESFFEDLGDFSADIVPLTIKELHEAVKSNTMKIIVVKKRQLQLYAGQPFSDVEMALHALVEENQNTVT